MQRVPRVLVPVIGVVALMGGAQALGAVPTFHHGLSRARVMRTARATNRVIVVMKSQQRGKLASKASVKARSATQARQRAR